MENIKHIIVAEKPKSLRDAPDQLILTPQEFINGEGFQKSKNGAPKVINLCSHYDYLSKGYYVSLLAEARGMPCIPSVANIIALNWRRNYEFALPELNNLLQKHYDEPFEEPLSRTYTTYFGRHDDPKIEPVARRLFDLFRFPIISFEVTHSQHDKWIIEKIDTESFTQLPEMRLKKFHGALDKFTGSAWRSGSNRKKAEKYWIAILHDPKESHPPSNKAALQKFVSVGKKLGLWVELITKQDFSSLLEYDAVLIRETTAINNHTYRFASKAEQEDIPCIDDTRSIIRCCNKVFLKELLDAYKIATPRTVILDRRTLALEKDNITFPAVLKIPDGSFSRGIEKVHDIEDLKYKAMEMLKKSEIVLCQEFVESEFDWRIGILNNEPIFALKYYMAKGHWQVYNHKAKSKKLSEGAHEPVPVKKIPKDVLETALKATKKIGNGLYGVDIKQTKDGRVVVIEVNDNPNVDSGVEDEFLGEEVYRKILLHLVKMIES